MLESDVSEPLRVVHYLNQFFGGVGGEDVADLKPQLVVGPKGPGNLLQRLVPEIEIVATLIAGDNYVAENLEVGVDEVLELIDALDTPPAVMIAGPAFNAGRYGMACAAVCERFESRTGSPAVTAMFPDNPAVASYRRQVIMVASESDVMGMQDALLRLGRVAVKCALGQALSPSEDQLIVRGLRVNHRAQSTGAVRAIDMALRLARGQSVETEYEMPSFDRVTPAAPLPSAANATIAVVTSGGIVPRGNPRPARASLAATRSTIWRVFPRRRFKACMAVMTRVLPMRIRIASCRSMHYVHSNDAVGSGGFTIASTLR
jgi:glycine reductase